jgi:hypothetical protein
MPENSALPIDALAAVTVPAKETFRGNSSPEVSGNATSRIARSRSSRRTRLAGSVPA